MYTFKMLHVDKVLLCPKSRFSSILFAKFRRKIDHFSLVILLHPGLKLLEIELFPRHAVVDKTANKTQKNGFALVLGPALKMIVIIANNNKLYLHAGSRP